MMIWVMTSPIGREWKLGLRQFTLDGARLDLHASYSLSSNLSLSLSLRCYLLVLFNYCMLEIVSASAPENRAALILLASLIC